MMTIDPRPAFRLETTWTPASEGGNPSYALTLTNNSPSPVGNFRLCFNGPARIDPAATIDGGTLVVRLSNHSEIGPPEGFALQPGKSWTVLARGLSYPLWHWTDGATTAYLTFADGAIVPVDVTPTRKSGDDAPLKRGAEIYPVPDGAPVPVSVIPWPQSVSVSGQLAVPAGLDVEGLGEEAQAAADAFAALSHSLFPVEGIVRPAAEGGFFVTVAIADGLGPEAYGIRFSAECAAVTGSTGAGLLYGLITLGQIVRGARRHPQTFIFPAEGEIRDEPALGWRGCHLDVARQFYGAAEILALPRNPGVEQAQPLPLAPVGRRSLAGRNRRLSRTHQGRRLARPWAACAAAARLGPAAVGRLLQQGGCPRDRGACRPAGHRGHAGDRRAGHCYSMLQAIPELRDPGERGSYFSVQGFPNNCLNPAREETYKVLETIFDELIALFPARVIHIGADEVPLGAWSGSPEALAMLAKLADEELAKAHARRLDVVTNTHGADEIEGSGAAVLQAEFLRRVQAFLASRGCITGGWEEAAHGHVIDKQKCYLNGWRNVEVSAALAGEGYDIVVNPAQVYYLDMANGPEWSEPGAAWAGWTSRKKSTASTRWRAGAMRRSGISSACRAASGRSR